MNKDCEIEDDAFTNTPLNETYMNNMGPDARCFEEDYGYCDNETYIYIVNINDYLTCTIEDNVDYYYEDEE